MKQLHTIIHSLKMANEQLSAADRVTDRHKKNQEEENKRYSTELSKARLQDLNRRESEKKRKSNRDLGEGWFDWGFQVIPHVQPISATLGIDAAVEKDVKKHGYPGWPFTKQWGDYWFERLYGPLSPEGYTQATQAELDRLAQPTVQPEPPPKDDRDIDINLPNWIKSGDEEVEEVEAEEEEEEIEP